MPDPVDVLIAGAGPAGSATALRLARRGHRVALVDRDAFPRDKACAEYLTPASVRRLHDLGISLDTIASPIDGTRVVSPGGHQLLGRFGAGTLRGMGVSRRALDSALVDAALAAGARLRRGRVVDLLRDAQGVAGAVIEDAAGRREDVAARVVVGADGLRSVVARRTGMHRQGRLRRMAFTAHLRGIEALSATTEMHVGPRGYVGINRLADGIANVSLVVPGRRAPTARGDADAFFHDTVRGFPLLRARLHAATVVRAVLVTGPFHAGSRRPSGDGFLLVGDAAEFFDPFTGDGIHSALHGADLAAEALHGALASPGRVTASRLRGYGRARARAFRGTRILERVIGYTMLAPALFDRAIAGLQRRDLGDLLLGATGHDLPVWRILNPRTLTRILA